MTLIELDVGEPASRDYLGHLRTLLDGDDFSNYGDQWPRAYDQIGDLLILKIPDALERFSSEIGTALLTQTSSARLVLRDRGVQGEFRVRQLEIIASRDGSKLTQTTVKENGCEILVDPARTYYSPRLAGERANTLKSARTLHEVLGRGLRVCDAYAGVGPALLPLLRAGLVKNLLANDLNPATTALLHSNLAEFSGCTDIRCTDARTLYKDAALAGTFDILLVNIPQSTLEHLAELLALLVRDQSCLLRGWCIVEHESIPQLQDRIESILREDGRDRFSLEISKVRSYSPSHEHLLIEAWLE